MTVESLLGDFHSKLLTMRRIESVIQSEKFEAVFEAASPEDQEELKKLIYQFDFERFRAVYDRVKIKSLDPGVMSIRELRARAKRAGVRNYNTLSKGLLVLEISREERYSGTTQSDAGACPPVRCE